MRRCDPRFDFVIGHALTGREVSGRRGQKIRAGIGFEQGFHFVAQCRADAGEQRFALAKRQFQRPVIQALDLFPWRRRVHDDWRFISRINQLRARRQSRLTVATETPIAPAVSSMLRPPK
jgi:hypothetical protein